jgi:formimidoylglutamate deiminase
VLLCVGVDGDWTQVQTGVEAPADAIVLDGPALPGLVNAHSHAFQRAFAGLAERRSVDQDDFWAWRDRMYRVALRIDPEQQRAIAAQLFLELVRSGYTQVCEFHYLHNASDGSVYAPDRLCMARAIVAAAKEVGIGLTLLPAVYERAGFTQPNLREDQRRFRADADAVVEMRDMLRISPDQGSVGGATALLQVGLALHSLRAAKPNAIEQVAAQDDPAPIHIHIAEQAQEVEDCLSATGLRPIEWLCRHAALDRRWQLIHATHSSPAEIETVARSGAGVVLCPSTEANLADGLTNLPAWLQHGVPLSLGSDSQVTRSAVEELRLLEYMQRCTKRIRCVSAAPQQGLTSTAERLWSRMLEGSGQAAGYPVWGLQVGARADLLVVDMAAPALLGIPASHTLDTLIFSSPVRPFRDTLIAGRWITRNHRTEVATAIGKRFTQAMQQIWQDVQGT